MACRPMEVLRSPVDRLASKAPRPTATLVLLFPPPLPTLWLLMSASPATSNRATGAEFPMPTFPFLRMTIASLLAPELVPLPTTKSRSAEFHPAVEAGV